MKKISLIICICLTAIIAMTACSNSILSESENLMSKTEADENQTYNFTNGESSAPTSYTSYTNAADNFAFTMLKSLYSSKKNTIFSSAGLYSQLALLQNASGGNTQKELKQLIGKNISLDDLNSCNGYFYSRLKELSNADKGYYVDINNNIFFNDGIPVSQDFLVKNADFYNQGLFRLDFADENTLTKINSYVSEQTNNKVNNILTSLNEDKGLTLTGTAFLKDKWINGYESEDITTDTFKGTSGNVKAEFMKSTEYYISYKNCTGFIKDFKNIPCRFVALLPDENTNIYKFIKSLNADVYQDIMGSMNIFNTCDAYLPQFSVNDTIDFKDALNNAGVTTMFSSDGDFSNLSYGATASVSNLTQSFELKITDGGVGTSKVSTSDATKKKATKQVKLNRPFVFLIVDNESNIPVYIGTISNI